MQTINAVSSPTQPRTIVGPQDVPLGSTETKHHKNIPEGSRIALTVVLVTLLVIVIIFMIIVVCKKIRAKKSGDNENIL